MTWMVVYYESGSHAELAAVYPGDDYPHAAMMAVHETVAKKKGMMVTESCGLTYEEMLERLWPRRRV